MYGRLLNEALTELATLLKAEDPLYGLPEGTKPPVSEEKLNSWR
jgi:hypothetical protein